MSEHTNITTQIARLWAKHGAPDCYHTARVEIPLCALPEGKAGKTLTELCAMIDAHHVDGYLWSVGRDVSEEYRVFRTEAMALIDAWIDREIALQNLIDLLKRED